MVLCLVVGCSKRSGRDKDVSFYRVPKIITNKGPRKEELSRQRRAGFILVMISQTPYLKTIEFAHNILYRECLLIWRRS